MKESIIIASLCALCKVDNVFIDLYTNCCVINAYQPSCDNSGLLLHLRVTKYAESANFLNI